MDAMVAGGRAGGQVDRLPRVHWDRADRSKGPEAPEARRFLERLGSVAQACPRGLEHGAGPRSATAPAVVVIE